jgi:hypothetical protein
MPGSFQPFPGAREPKAGLRPSMFRRRRTAGTGTPMGDGPPFGLSPVDQRSTAGRSAPLSRMPCCGHRQGRRGGSGKLGRSRERGCKTEQIHGPGIERAPHPAHKRNPNVSSRFEAVASGSAPPRFTPAPLSFCRTGRPLIQREEACCSDRPGGPVIPGYG